MVIVFGSIDLDLIFTLQNIPRAGKTVLGPSTRIEPGGKGANQAVAAPRDGGDAIMVGSVGHDALADGAIALLRAARVDMDRVRTVETSTGCAAIAVDPAGNNAIGVGSGANRSTSHGQVEYGLLGPATPLVLQMELAAIENATLIAHARPLGSRVVLNLAPTTPLREAALQAVSWWSTKPRAPD